MYKELENKNEHWPAIYWRTHVLKLMKVVGDKPKKITYKLKILG